MEKMEDRYIGDGVYASFDGLGIALDLRNQSPTPTNRIYLEPEVWANLVKYQRDAEEFNEKRSADYG